MIFENLNDKKAFFQDFGVRATLKNLDGESWEIIGIFDHDMVETDLIGEAPPIFIEQPRFVCLERNLPPIENGFSLKIGKKNYSIMVTDTDGTGFVTLVLHLKKAI